MLISYHMLMLDIEPERLAAFKTWNFAMKAVRISIEWDYGGTASLFEYVSGTKRKLKLLKNSDAVSKIYIVATILRDCHICLYGCQTSNYFEVDIPENFLENYINQEI